MEIRGVLEDKKSRLAELNVRPYTLDEIKSASRGIESIVPKSRYPRSGTEELSLFEKKISNVLDIDSKNLLVFTYGMAAVVAAIESTSPNNRTVILHGKNEYSNNKNYINKTLQKRGVMSIEVDSYKIEKLESVIEESKPQIVFLETVGNGLKIPVLDLEKFFQIKYLKEKKPLIILDNTLAAGVITPKQILTFEGNVIGVESGLKFYTRHEGAFGFLYTNNNNLIPDLAEYRKQTGTTPDLYQTKLISSKLIGRWDFHIRNDLIFRNAKIIAELSNEMCNKNSAFAVHYPNLTNHENYGYVKERFPQGAAPLFFIEPKNGITELELTEELLKNPIIQKSCEIIESFGYDFTAIWPNTDMSFVRISAGTEKEDEVIALGNAFKESLRGFS